MRIDLNASQVTVTATANGDGTGIIPDTVENVSVVSSVNTKKVSLPTPTPGVRVKLYCATNGYKLISNDPTNVAINSVSGAAKALAVAATDLIVAECVRSADWFVYKVDALGAPATAGIPA